MNRLAQSYLIYLALGLLLALAVLNTVQLHNLEKKVAELGRSGPAAPVSTAPVVPSTCTADPEEEAALADPANLLHPRRLPAATPSTVARGDTLRRMLGNDPPGLNYLASHNAADVSEIYRYVTDRLAERDFDDPGRWNTSLAVSVTTPDEGLTYLVKLRKGVKWQKPAVDLRDPRYAWLNVDHEVTADDFRFSFDVLLNPQVGGRAAAARSGYSHLDHVEVVDKYTLKVVFKEALYFNFETVTDTTPMPEWLYRYDENGHRFDDTNWGEKLNSHWYNQKAIGTGPYQFVSWEPGVKIQLAANPEYWNCERPPNFDKVEMPVLKDQQAWLRYLKTGKLDYVQIMPQQYTSELKGKEPYLGEKGLKLAFHDESSYFYVGWNLRRPFFQDKQVRKAMTMALDRQGLLDNVFAGQGSVISGPFPSQNACYDSSIAPLPYDLAKAAELLDAAGWKDSDGDGVRDKVVDGKKVPFSFSLLIYGGSNEYDTLARVYREALLSIGVKMMPEGLEWSAQLKKMDEKDFDAYTGAWVLDPEVDLKPTWSSAQADVPQSSNYIEFRNAEADKLIDAHRHERDPAKRTALCRQFHALIAEEQPYTFFYQRKRPVLYWDYMNDLLFAQVNPYRDLRYMSFRSPRP